MQKIFLKKKSDFYCLGGPGILPKDENFFGRSANLFNISKIFYPFPERYASINEKRFQNYDDWPSVNLFVSRKIFIKIGGFDPKYWPGEDSKLCEKLINKKIKILYDPGVITYHYKRSDLIKHLNQNFRYGFHRGKFFIEGDQNSRKFIFILPSLFLLYNLLVFLIPIKVFMIPIILYVSILLFDLKNSIKYERNILVLFYSRIIFYITHNAYGLGFLTSLLSKNYKLKLGR